MNDKYAKKDPLSEEVRIKIHKEAIIENLVAFHGKSREDAEKGVNALDLEHKPIILKSGPYFLAWELARGVEHPPTPQQVRQHRTVADKIFSRANMKFMYQR